MQGAGPRVQGSGCRVQGAGCRVQGLGSETCVSLISRLESNKEEEGQGRLLITSMDTCKALAKARDRREGKSPGIRVQGPGFGV